MRVVFSDVNEDLRQGQGQGLDLQGQGLEKMITQGQGYKQNKNRPYFSAY